MYKEQILINPPGKRHTTQAKEKNMSKGSSRRPTDQQKYNDNWDAIFGKKPKEQPPSQKDK